VKCIDEEIPFEIPSSWEWCRLGNICSYLHRGKSPKYGEYKILPIIAQKCNQWDKVYTDRCLFSSKDYIEKYKEEQFVLEGDIIINSTGGGTVGRTGYIDSFVFTDFDRFVVDSHVTLVRSIYPIASKYIYYFLISPLIQIGLEDRCSGSTNQIELGTTTIANYLVPIPPINEQNRIIEQIQKILPLLERYSASQIAQKKLNAEINILLKKSILQEAIQGKLVPQIVEDGTAEELLAEIRKEKERLVKEGKLKKSAQSDSVIFKGDDNKYYEQVGEKCEDITDFIPFDLPSSWIWVRGKSVFMPMESTKPASDFVYIDVDAVNNKINIIDNPKYLKQENAPSRATRKLHKNDLLFSMVRPYLKNIALVDEKYKDAIASTGFYVVTPGLGYTPKFLFYIMLSNYVIDGLNLFMKGDNSPSINNCHIEDYLYPLPPLKEQHRIVAQIEKLFEQLR
jgi:type I restriction enzyme S subunit